VGSDGGEDIHCFDCLLALGPCNVVLVCVRMDINCRRERERWDPWGMAVVPGPSTGGVWQPLPVAAEAYESSTSSVRRDVGVSYYDGL
jgi:hypothetical protein